MAAAPIVRSRDVVCVRECKNAALIHGYYKPMQRLRLCSFSHSFFCERYLYSLAGYIVTSRDLWLTTCSQHVRSFLRFFCIEMLFKIECLYLNYLIYLAQCTQSINLYFEKMYLVLCLCSTAVNLRAKEEETLKTSQSSGWCISYHQNFKRTRTSRSQLSGLLMRLL